MRVKAKEDKGITLIALVITIIVMLILVGVTINVAMQGGLFDTARETTKGTEIEADKEILQGAIVASLDIETGTVNKGKLIDNLPGWRVEGEGPYTCTSPSPKENVFSIDIKGNEVLSDLETLERYFLGENKTGRDLFEMLDTNTMKFINNENEIIPNAGSSLRVLVPIGVDVGGSTSDINETYMIMHVYVVYNNKAYRIEYHQNLMEGNAPATTQSVAFVYEQKGREGQTIEYSYDGTEANKKEWKIIYDNGTNVEIVSPDVISNLTLGARDTNAIGEDNVDKAINSYNNAVDRLNNYCASLVTNPDRKISVRSVGSNQNGTSSQEDTFYSSEQLATLARGKYNGKAKIEDLNYEQDIVRMSFHNVPDSESAYWLASRAICEIPGEVRLYVRTSVNYVFDSQGNICDITNNSNGMSQTYGVRPVVKLLLNS